MSFIALATAGEVDGEAAAWARDCVESSFGLPARFVAPFPSPEHAYDPARGQYSSTLILRDALQRVPAGAAKVLVLTEADLFIPMLSFVYGQAQLGGTAAIVSLARLHQRFYGLPENRPLLLVRLRKEALHELGHAWGLTHCEDRLCTMSLSTGIQQLDVKGAGFCDGCAVRLHDVTGAARAAAIDSGG
ncbi:MAG TPA: archaemetzincin family Zn-dependent metalloprotease [Thermoanaerobaculia bacterium]|nr:archaemetzincin family Zn-dependent metalloprotease [Thermoanaerobaculia bacterium]